MCSGCTGARLGRDERDALAPRIRRWKLHLLALVDVETATEVFRGARGCVFDVWKNQVAPSRRPRSVHGLPSRAGEHGRDDRVAATVAAFMEPQPVWPSAEADISF
jgi:hypothetical protein